MKELIKKILKSLPFALSKNHHYDILTKKIISRYTTENSNCVDVGCFKGEILDLMLEAAPKGQHYAFEPIPSCYKNLDEKYKGNDNCHILNYALSNQIEVTSFNYVKSNPSYSGLLKRDYDRKDEVDESIEVKTNMMDELIPSDLSIDLIKIDVEGAELLVLEGAQRIISTYKPIVVFEYGIGAANHYNTTPEKLFNYFEGFEMNISTLDKFLKQKAPLNMEAFKQQYYSKKNYYFIAYPK